MRVFFLLLTALAGGVAAFLLLRTPRLEAASVWSTREYLCRAATGYPVASYDNDDSTQNLHWYSESELGPKNPYGRLLGYLGPEWQGSPDSNILVSFLFQYYYIYRRDRGAITHQISESISFLRPFQVTNTGFMLTATTLYDPEGKTVALPKGFKPASWCTCVDGERLVGYVRSPRRFCVFDPATRKITHDIVMPAGTVDPLLLAVAGARVIMLNEKAAQIFEGGKLIATATAPNGDWQMGGDGSVWSAGGHRVTVLRWRTGALASTDYSRENDGAAVWGDGAWLATYTVEPYTRTRLSKWVEQLSGGRWFQPAVRWRVTLYRFGSPRASASETVGAVNAGSIILEPNALTFRHDGRYLAWIVPADYGLTQVRYYAVPAE